MGVSSEDVTVTFDFRANRWRSGSGFQCTLTIDEGEAPATTAEPPATTAEPPSSSSSTTKGPCKKKSLKSKIFLFMQVSITQPLVHVERPTLPIALWVGNIQMSTSTHGKCA